MVLRPIKRKAGKAGAYVAAALYVFMAVMAVRGIFYVIGGDMTGAVEVACVIVAVSVLLFVMSRCLSWYDYAKIEEKDSSIIYTVQEALDSVGKTCYTIKSVTDVKKLRGRNVKVFGDIEVKEALRRTKPVKYVVIFDYTDEVLYLLDKYRKGGIV